MNKVTITLDDGSEVVLDNLDEIRVRQHRPVVTRRNERGAIVDIQPGRVTTTTIVVKETR